MADSETTYTGSEPSRDVIDLSKLSIAPLEVTRSLDCDTRCRQGGYHAAHVFIIAKTQKKLFDEIPMRGFVLMQLRFDGLLGFPGGKVDEGESACQGLNRELKEEIGIKEDLCTEDDFLYSSHGSYRDVKLHFYTKLVSEEELEEIETNALSAHERGLEVLGLVRVPLYIYDKERGLPAFLKQNLIGTAREQLLLGLQKHNMIEIDESGGHFTLV